MNAASQPPEAQALARSGLWRLGVGLLFPPVAVGIAATAFPHLQLAETAAGACAFAGATACAIVGLSFAAMVEVPLVAALTVAALCAGLLITLAVVQPGPVATVLLVNSGLVGLAWALGCTLGRRVQHPAHLFPACVVAASADLISLLSPEGPSHAIAESERALSVLAVWFPVPGSSALAPALGLGDLLFMALTFGVARAHGLPYLRCVLACAAGTALAGGAAACSGLAIPALVPIAAMLVVTLPAIRKLRRSDRAAALWSMLIAGAVALATLVRMLLSGH